MGHAAGDAEDAAGLRPRCAEKPRARPARSCRSSATGPTTGSRSRCRRATSRTCRDPAVILIDQLKEVYIDGELETIDTTNWFPKVMRKDYIVGLNLRGQRARPRPESLSSFTGAVPS